MTLRALALMATERKRLMGELTAWHVIRIGMMFGGKPIEPNKINPYREPEPVKRKTAEETAYQNVRNMKVLDAFFGGGAWKPQAKGTGGQRPTKGRK